MAEKLAEQLGAWPEVAIASAGPRKEDESFLNKVITPIYRVIHQVSHTLPDRYNQSRIVTRGARKTN